MGSLNYLSTIRVVDAVIGNSSSGIVEAPFLKTPTINIGERQNGRVKAKSIIAKTYSEYLLSSLRPAKNSCHLYTLISSAIYS